MNVASSFDNYGFKRLAHLMTVDKDGTISMYDAHML